MKIRLGISTCPNDTFAHAGLLEGATKATGVDLDIRLADVQELNEALERGELDVAKASFHAALGLADRFGVLPVGAALGFGNGPLLLAAREGGSPADFDGAPRVLCPGAGTTATMLYRLFHDAGEVEQAVFDRIMPALENGEADFGVCIHEGRFTWKARGLHLVEDLGERWERETGSPLPLGGLLARKDLDPGVLAAVTEAVRASLSRSQGDPLSILPTMRRWAAELDDDVIMSHVDLYVNAWTMRLGGTGGDALAELSRRARAAGVIPEDAPELEILGD